MKKVYYQNLREPLGQRRACDGLQSEINAAYKRTNDFIRSENKGEMSKNMRTVKMMKLR